MAISSRSVPHLNNTHCVVTATLSPVYRSDPYQIPFRAFSTSRLHLGGRQAAHTEPKHQFRLQVVHRRQARQREYLASKDVPSRYTRLREVMNSADVPEDLGIFEGTLIMPSGGILPPYLTSPLRRLKIERHRIWKRTQDFLSVLVWKSSLGFWKSKISFRKTAPTAMALHRHVYSAFADGDEDSLHNFACDGVRDKLIDQIEARPNDTLFKWDLVKYKGRSTVVSHRASQLPLDQDEDGEKSFVRQAVVRIRSVQRLTREEVYPDEDHRRQVETPEGAEKEITEYIVVQKRVVRGEEEPWKFWGTTGETSLEYFEEVLRGPGAKDSVTNG